MAACAWNSCEQWLSCKNAMQHWWLAAFVDCELACSFLPICHLTDRNLCAAANSGSLRHRPVVSSAHGHRAVVRARLLMRCAHCCRPLRRRILATGRGAAHHGWPVAGPPRASAGAPSASAWRSRPGGRRTPMPSGQLSRGRRTAAVRGRSPGRACEGVCERGRDEIDRVVACGQNTAEVQERVHRGVVLHVGDRAVAWA